MAENMKANPDYQLVMRFLELIQPGDMDEDSANQLMMIGQRIQSGGALSDKEREMFQSVVGAMPANPTPPPATSMGQMTDAEQRMAEEEAFQAMVAEQNQMRQPMMDGLSSGAMSEAEVDMMRQRATSPRPMLRPNR